MLVVSGYCRISMTFVSFQVEPQVACTLCDEVRTWPPILFTCSQVLLRFGASTIKLRWMCEILSWSCSPKPGGLCKANGSLDPWCLAVQKGEVMPFFNQFAHVLLLSSGEVNAVRLKKKSCQVDIQFVSRSFWKSTRYEMINKNLHQLIVVSCCFMLFHPFSA